MMCRFAPRRARRWRGVLVGLSLAASACSSDDLPPAAAPVAEAPQPPGGLVVEATEFRFDRTSWTIPAGQPVRIDFWNRGTIAHEWAVLGRGPDIHRQSEFREDMVLLEVESIPEGTTHSQALTIHEPGTYQVVCALPGHIDAGMSASLIVTAPAPL